MKFSWGADHVTFSPDSLAEIVFLQVLLNYYHKNIKPFTGNSLKHFEAFLERGKDWGNETD